jgi:hypothetical protein
MTVYGGDGDDEVTVYGEGRRGEREEISSSYNRDLTADGGGGGGGAGFGVRFGERPASRTSRRSDASDV